MIRMRFAGWLVGTILLVSSAIGCGLDTGAPKEKIALKESLSAISESDVKSDLQQLTGAAPALLSSGAVTIDERKSMNGRARARQWIRERMESFGLRVSEQPISGGAGANIEGVLEGSPDGRHLYVTAHFDSVASPAANDNASGTVALLAAARAVGRLRTRDWVHFIAFDLEESGLVGSKAYVKEKVLPLLIDGKARILGNLHLDMVGYNTGANRVALTDCNTAPELVDAAMLGIEEGQLDLRTQKGCAGSSDNVSFSEQNIPALMFMDETYFTRYPWYHLDSDTADKLDSAFLTRVSQALTATIIKLTFP